MDKTKVIFVRHGEADGNINRIFHGQFNSNITATGHIQAKLTANFLIPHTIDVLYASDLRRTMDTAGYISRQKGLPIIPHKGLREVDGGEWENLPWEVLPQRFPEAYDRWVYEPHKAQLPHGESMQQLQNRIHTTINKIVDLHMGKTICIVTHGTAIRSMLSLWQGLPIDHMTQMPWYDNASVTIVEYTGNGYQLILEGENSHLQQFSTLAKQTWWKK